MNNIKRIKAVGTMICVIYSLFLMMTFIRTSSYAIPSTDDFSAKAKINGVCAPLDIQISTAVESAKRAYRGWQGTYTTYFAGELLNPLNNYGTRQMRYEMAAFTTFFFVSVVLLVAGFIRKAMPKQYLIGSAVLCAILHSICAYESYPEIFQWFAGSITYCVPLALIFVGLSMCVLSDGFNKWIPFIIAMIIGPIAMGGVLIDVAIGCYGLLLLLGFYSFSERKIKVRRVIVFAEWVIFAGVNAFAPGNFVRHERFDQSGLNPIEAVQNALLIAEQRWEFLLEKGFVAVLLILFICGIVSAINCSTIKTAMVFASLGLLMPIVAAFPLALGYSDSRVPNRCAFSIDMAVIVSSAAFALSTGIVISNWLEREARKTVILNASILALVCLMLDGYGYSGIKAVEMNNQLKRGEFQERYSACKYMLDELGTYEKGTDAFINRNQVPKDIDNTYSLHLEADPNARWNTEIASFFGLNSLTVIEEDNVEE